MWPLALVILAPDLGNLPRVLEAAEQWLVETFAQKSADETVGKHGLHRRPARPTCRRFHGYMH